jgi:hypothetical protein
VWLTCGPFWPWGPAWQSLGTVHGARIWVYLALRCCFGFRFKENVIFFF